MKTQLLITCLVIGSYVACAQDGGERGKDKDAKIKTKTVMDIKIKPKKEIQFYFTDKEHFDNGILEEAVTEIKVKANVNWQIHVNSSNEYFEDADGNQMPVNIFSIAKSGEQLQPLSYNPPPQPVATGTVGNDKKETNTFDLDYFADPGYGYAPGVYRVDLVYTISAQ